MKNIIIKYLVVIPGIILVVSILIVLLSVNWNRPSSQNKSPSVETQFGIRWVKATTAGSDEVIVNGRPAVWDTSPKTDLEVTVIRFDGSTLPISSKAERKEGSPVPDFGGGVRALVFKSNIPTTVYVTIK